MPHRTYLSRPAEKGLGGFLILYQTPSLVSFSQGSYTFIRRPAVKVGTANLFLAKERSN